MIEVPITDEMILQARDKSREMGKLNKSILKGGGNLAGFIGEFVAQVIMGGRIENTYQYDLVLEDGTKVDVKTKQTGFEPKPEYDCSISSESKIQDCDKYAFVRVKNDLTIAWFLGSVSKVEFFKKAIHFKRGEIDPSNKYTVKADCWNLKIKDLD